MAYKAKNKEVTLTEFQAWLEGVEELQAKNWSPDATQWKLIRNKIKNIVADEPIVMTAPIPATPVPGRPGIVRAAEASVLGIPPAPDVGGSGFPEKVEIAAPSAEASALLAGDASAKRKTPDLDTADGNYESTFT